MSFRYRTWIGPLLFLILALIVWGCGLAAPTPTSQAPTLTAPTEGPQDTPSAVSNQQQYTSQDFGFSLSYPAGYEIPSGFPHTVLFLAPPGTPGHRERAWITVEFSSEQNAAWYANNAKQANANLGTGITSSVQAVDGQQAYILGRLSGQDVNRQVFIVDNGILYHLTFVPDDPAAGEEYQQMEALYAAIMGSLRFLPERRAVPPLTDITNMMHELERALNARSTEGIARLLGDEFVLGVLDPSTVQAVKHARYRPADVIPIILQDHLSPNPSLTLLYQVDWSSVPGSLDTYSGIFPGEVVTPILAKGWGTNGAGEAVIIIARRADGSLFWRGAFDLIRPP